MNYRSISSIANDIRRDWGAKINYGAKPYLSAMMQLNSMDDKYGEDRAESIVAYFLSNATTWRGEKAKQIKAELNAMLKGKPYTALVKESINNLKRLIEAIVERKLRSRNLNEDTSVKSGPYEFSSSNGIGTLKYNGRVLSTGDFDTGADGYFMSHSSLKSQKFFEDGKAVIAYFKSNRITENTIKEAAGQRYTIEIDGPRSTRTTSGTLPELIDYFGYTLEKGKSWEHEKGNKKIDINPKNIASLIKNLNNATNNAAANGYSGTTYRLA